MSVKERVFCLTWQLLIGIRVRSQYLKSVPRTELLKCKIVVTVKSRRTEEYEGQSREVTSQSTEGTKARVGTRRSEFVSLAVQLGS